MTDLPPDTDLARLVTFLETAGYQRVQAGFQAILDEATRTFTNFVNALESAGFDLDADPDQASPDTSQVYFLDLIKRIDGMSDGS